MAGIPRSRIVGVTIGTAPTFRTSAGFGTANMLGRSTVLNAQVRAALVSDPDELLPLGFTTSSEEYQGLQTYFSQDPRPTRAMVSRWVIDDLPAELRGGSGVQQTIATWQAITDGSFALNIGGTSNDVTGLDFSGDA